MEQEITKKKPRLWRGMKRFSGTNETVARAPANAEPIEVQVPALTVPVEIRDIF
ncbi:hypothetical protein KKH14_00285 [Patescibacteria group bacterium]|nr:hypothetical protein [Patescibacteria group bacterium]